MIRTSEGMSFLQKFMFLFAISGCFAMYLRYSKAQ